MPTNDRRRRADEVLRRTFSGAHLDGEPGIERLVATVPAILEEASRRRRLESDPAALISAAAFQWLPRLATATAILVLLAAVWPQRAEDTPKSLGAWLGEGVGTVAIDPKQDPVLEALIE